MLTHTFNAMPGIHHRNPGPIAAALNNGEISMGLIADGIHVHPSVAVLLQRLASEKLVLVSDAISAYGLKDGLYQWDNRPLTVTNGTCRLKDGTLAGTTLPLLEGVKRLAKWSGQPAASIWSATIAPRMALNKQCSFVDYFVGKSMKNLLRWHQDLKSNDLSWQRAA